MQKMKVIENIDLNQIVNLNKEQAKTRYNIGENYLYELSKEIGADIYIGKKHLYNKKKLDEYFETIGDYKPDKWGRV